ncbi:MAG TPA: helix-turn-helix transcriptional regulator [Actinocrinis sp.]|nr:helix-turn-helix transcriptional regulator [Actinocrinis sp.]
MSVDNPGERTFARLLREARHSAGYTQEDLAGKAKVSIRTIGNLERGVIRQPRPSTVRHLAKALAMSHADTVRLHNAAHPHR